jgi:UDP-N-acetylglucosamine 2-epimerase (non-hydrolysing)
MTMKVVLVAGARPNFMKVAPIVDALKRYNSRDREKSPQIDYFLVHTGQHYDNEMSESFFEQLNLPCPDIHLGVGSGTHAEQTAKIMIAFEKVCFRLRPDLVVVVGDVNSTMACAVVAAKLCIPVAHVEAGLRSFDRTMPEEINRVITDQISDLLFTTSADANQNLIREGIPEEKIYLVGNVMIDTLKKHLGAAKKSMILENLGLKKNGKVRSYSLLTLHRPSNVDEPTVLAGIMDVLLELSSKVPIIFPMHPRTFKQMKKFNLLGRIHYIENIQENRIDKFSLLATPPLGYLDFLCLMSRARFVLTDSGGIQEETTILGIPCLTLRNNTERPVTVNEGTNFLTGNNPGRIKKVAAKVMRSGVPRRKIPRYWDGKASERIVRILKSQF